MAGIGFYANDPNTNGVRYDKLEPRNTVVRDSTDTRDRVLMVTDQPDPGVPDNRAAVHLGTGKMVLFAPSTMVYPRSIVASYAVNHPAQMQSTATTQEAEVSDASAVGSPERLQIQAFKVRVRKLRRSLQAANHRGDELELKLSRAQADYDTVDRDATNAKKIGDYWRSKHAELETSCIRFERQFNEAQTLLTEAEINKVLAQNELVRIKDAIAKIID